MPPVTEAGLRSAAPLVSASFISRGSFPPGVFIKFGFKLRKILE